MYSVAKLDGNELERIWKKVVRAQFKVLSRHLPGGTEKCHETLQPEWSVPKPRFEQGISRIKSGRVTASFIFLYPIPSQLLLIMVGTLATNVIAQHRY
jgi:hypothetical protein